VTAPGLAISLCELAFPYTTFERDVAICGQVGAAGMSIDERKLVGDDQAAVRLLQGQGLHATICATNILYLLPMQQRTPTRPDPGPLDPERRIEALCQGIRRLGAFSPEVVLSCTGPAAELGDQRARSIVVEGLRQAARTAAEVGTRLGIEPMREQVRDTQTIICSIEDALKLIEEIGDDRVGIVFDTWHLWDSPHVLESARRFAPHIIGVQVADYRDPPRSARDRTIPGEGCANLPRLFDALEAGGYSGWYDIEIFSDELWKLEPEEFAQRSVDGLRRVWQQRTAQTGSTAL
jgi:sugar phosphate isomerase/epimerase